MLSMQKRKQGYEKKMGKFPGIKYFYFLINLILKIQFKKFLKKLITKILYFITGDYAQIPKEFISENRLFLSCLRRQ